MPGFAPAFEWSTPRGRAKCEWLRTAGDATESSARPAAEGGTVRWMAVETELEVVCYTA